MIWQEQAVQQLFPVRAIQRRIDLMWVCGVCASFQSCFLWFLLSNVFNLHWENILGPGTKGQQMEIDLPWSCVALQAHVSRWNFTLYSANLCFACESDFCYGYVDTIIIYYIARFPATITAPFTLRLVMHLSNEARTEFALYELIAMVALKESTSITKPVGKMWYCHH